MPFPFYFTSNKIGGCLTLQYVPLFVSSENRDFPKLTIELLILVSAVQSVHVPVNLLYLCLMELGIRTCEVDIADVLEQQCAVNGIHLGAEANFSGTEIFVHVV